MLYVRSRRQYQLSTLLYLLIFLYWWSLMLSHLVMDCLGANSSHEDLDSIFYLKRWHPNIFATTLQWLGLAWTLRHNFFHVLCEKSGLLNDIIAGVVLFFHYDQIVAFPFPLLILFSCAIWNGVQIWLCELLWQVVEKFRFQLRLLVNACANHPRWCWWLLLHARWV